MAIQLLFKNTLEPHFPQLMGLFPIGPHNAAK